MLLCLKLVTFLLASDTYISFALSPCNGTGIRRNNEQGKIIGKDYKRKERESKRAYFMRNSLETVLKVKR